jgi:hypothetical protein
MVLAYLFHPRREELYRQSSNTRSDMMIKVDEKVEIGASLHLSDTKGPTILFFHGNGKIVSDYDEIGPLCSITWVLTFLLLITGGTEVQPAAPR